MNETRRAVVAGIGALSFALPPVASRAAEASGAGVRVRTLADGIRGPEGTSLLADGSVTCVEFTAGNLLRITQHGAREVLCAPGPGVVGTALGLDGALYVVKLDPIRFARGHRAIVPPRTSDQQRSSPSGARSGAGDAAAASSPARILRLDLRTRALQTLYTACDGAPLAGPDDLVVDRWGDLWVSDMIDNCVYWCRPDGTSIRRVIGDMPGINGIALSPDHTRLYIIGRGRLLAYDIVGRGTLATAHGRPTARELAVLPPNVHLPDGMRTERDGNIVCACWGDGLYVYRPDGALLSRMALPGVRIINLCFGGADLRTAYLAAVPPDGMTGMLLSIPWPRAGMRLPV
jgi:gluconolactonase